MGTAATQAKEVLNGNRAVSDALVIRPARQWYPTPAPRALRLRQKVIRLEAG